MELRVLDELISPPGRGVVLLCLDGDTARALAGGMRLWDVRGNCHRLAAVTEQEALYTLHLPDADPAYFERLFRDVKVDATLLRFDPSEDAPCP